MSEQRCDDCGVRLRGTHYIEVKHPGVAVCGGCVEARRQIDGPDTWWWGLEWRREILNPVPILMGVYCICAAIVCLVLLFRMH